MPQVRARPCYTASIALCLALIGAGSMLYYDLGLFFPRVGAVRNAAGLGNGYSFGDDFYPVWLTSRQLLRQRRDLYSPEMTREIQIGLYGRPLDPSRPSDPIDQRVFLHPAFTDLLFWPAGEFPFRTVRLALVFTLSLLTFSSVPLWLYALDWHIGWKWLAVAELLTLCSYPALEGLYSCQLGLLVTSLLAASLMALRHQRFLLAGVLMAVSTIKPQITLFAIIFLLLWSASDWRRRNRFYLGFVPTLLLLISGSIIVWPNWIWSWTQTVLAYRRYTQAPLLKLVVTAPLGPRLEGPATFLLTLAAVVFALLLAWRNRRVEFASFAFWATLTVLLSITAIAALQGIAVYDHLILLPGILLVVRHRNELLHNSWASRVLLWIGGLVLLWPWMAALLVILAHFFLRSSIFESTAVLSLPLRTAASLPFAVLALLSWAWRAHRIRSQGLV